MAFRIIKVWPFWPNGLLYHDQHLDLTMRCDDVATLFIVPSFEDHNYSQFTHDYCDKFNVVYLKSASLFGKPIPYDVFTLLKTVRDWKPDVIHIFGISNFISIATIVIGVLLGYARHLVFSDHSDPRERKSSIGALMYYQFFRAFFRFFINKNTKIITPDIASEGEIKRRYGPLNTEQLLQIPLGYDSSIFYDRARRGVNRDKLVIGFAGKINEAKRLDVLLAALQKVDGLVECRLVGMPASDFTEYQNWLVQACDVHNRSSRNKVRLETFIKDPVELAEFYNEVDVVVFPGSISITTQEATGCGTPIILYRSYEGLEHRVDGGRGWLFTRDDELVSLINQVYELHSEERVCREKISAAARRYSWHNLKHRYYELYLNVHGSSFLKKLIDNYEGDALTELPSHESTSI